MSKIKSQAQILSVGILTIVVVLILGLSSIILVITRNQPASAFTPSESHEINTLLSVITNKESLNWGNYSVLTIKPDTDVTNLHLKNQIFSGDKLYYFSQTASEDRAIIFRPSTKQIVVDEIIKH